MALTRRAIRVYAALDGLKSRREEDVLDALLPFMAPILQFIRGRPFHPRFLVMGTSKLYGWNITIPVAEAFQERLIKNGWLVQGSAPGTWVCHAPEDTPLDSKEVAISTAIDAIIDELQRFAPTLSNYYNPSRSREELKDALIRFLVSLDGYSATALAQNLHALDADAPTNGPLHGLEDGGEPLSEQDTYLCAKFVKHLADINSPQLNHLTKLVAVGLLTEVVVDFVKPTSSVKKSDLVVVLDAPLAMDLIGTSGPTIQQDALNITKSLSDIGCKFVVFETSCNEISRALNAMLRLAPNLRHGLTHSAIVRSEISEDFVRTVAADPEEALEQAGIPVRHVSLTSYPNAHHYFSSERFDEFKSGINWYSDDARTHDAECMALVMRLRAGAHRRDPLACSHVFVTGNRLLSQYARRYCIDNSMIQARHSGPIVHQRDLAVAAWLRTGFNGEVMLRGHLVAVCERVLKIRTDVIAHAQAIVEKARPDRRQELELVLRDSRSVTRLMDQAMGVPAIISAADADRLLDDLIRATTHQLEEQHRERLAVLDTALADRDKVILAQTERLDLLEQEGRNRLAERSAKIFEAGTETNTLTARVDAAFAYALYGCACILAVQAIAVEMNLIRPFGIFWLLMLPVAGLSAYHLIQDIRQRPKWGIDDLLSVIAKWDFRRRLMRRGVVDIDTSEYAVHQGQLSLTSRGVWPQPLHKPSSVLPSILRTTAARIGALKPRL